MDARLEHIHRQPHFGEDWFQHESVYRMLVENCRPDGKIVEVGCWKGRSTAYLLVEAFNKSQRIEVYAVDTWEGSPEHAGHEAIVGGTLYQQFLANVKPVSRQLIPLRIPSPKAADFFPDGILDAVFIDAAHEYDAVLADILAWRSKVRDGGILAGHDYGAGWPGVDQAVNEVFDGVESKDCCWIKVLT